MTSDPCVNVGGRPVKNHPSILGGRLHHVVVRPSGQTVLGAIAGGISRGIGCARGGSEVIRWLGRPHIDAATCLADLDARLDVRV